MDFLGWATTQNQPVLAGISEGQVSREMERPLNLAVGADFFWPIWSLKK
jgi:hypothetical protein